MNEKVNNEDLHWVYQSIVNWKELAEDRERLKDVLSRQANTFYFLKGQIPEDNIHTYLGIFNETIFLHFIPSSSDIKESFVNKLELPCPIYSCVGTSEIFIGGVIEKEDALNRIKNWSDDNLRNNALDTNDFHRAFFMPNDNFKDNVPLKVTFALNENVPDLVIEQMGLEAGFYDTCRPVPPFPPSTIEESFALLKVIDSWMNN